MADGVPPKLSFFIGRSGNRYEARSADHELTVTAPTLKLLRERLNEEVGRRFGPSRRISLLLGRPRFGPRRRATLPRLVP